MVIVQSNKYRRFAPKDFTWQECISFKRDRDVTAMLQKLNATEWVGSVSRDDKEKMIEAKRLERDAHELVRNSKKKNKRKMEKAAMKVMDVSFGDGSEVVIPVPEGKTNLRIKLLLSWD